MQYEKVKTFDYISVAIALDESLFKLGTGPSGQRNNIVDWKGLAPLKGNL